MHTKFRTYLFIFINLILSLAACSALAAEVRDIRVAQQEGVTRLVFELSDTAEHRIFPLSNPDRIVLDISGVDLNASVVNGLSALSSDVLMRVRYARRDSGVRFVLDLGQAAKAKSTVLAANGTYGPRILVELEYGARKPATIVKSLASLSKEKRDIVIAIDPGHGGKDPGALGKYNVREKDIVLSIGKELARRINAVDGFKAVLTRSTDKYLQLRDRSRVAREANADLMISIHADAFTKSSARGASVWALSLSGKSSEMGRWLAQQENSADLVGGISLDDKDQLLAEVLLDMSMNSTIQMSLNIGKSVLGEMKGVAVLHKNTVQQAGFVVLKSPDIPSILVETGFVSNKTEAKNLSSRTYRVKLAGSISKGVIEYFTKNAPDGTLVAWKQKQHSDYVYTVSKGDTLSEIARRNQVSLSILRQANKLNNDVIWIGQKLVIPAG
ncbi:LysM peptidoglycan-binding domain-containing protein [Marinomonas rhizomae]|uniref:N-acetylmuramoyl-L-alanine amidase AmiC n=1 Tax=Marinomonas rhizomae TaxID=491948 RepID=A0A366JBI9_9GAMM|nr:N-acetylmuramoyl-L-alanine amidase [Marinomonas rhizomae]RBP84361.1 N-acetylmuramoyl-L-alanine amidase [Marinomonas rhizomae]RNF74677.1 LysM peptidoglycan-binding domain-containing protein [Marinomonas rhizomae]